MDIRDFNKPEQAPTPYTIREIFRLQKELLDKYVAIEKMAKYPVNIDAPSDQIMIKDFIARITEELGEGYESYLTLRVLHKNGTLTGERALPLLFNFNEELADAIHFMVETMIVTGIDVSQLEGAIGEMLFVQGYGMVFTGDLYNAITSYLYEVVKIPSLAGLMPQYPIPEEHESLLIQGGRCLTQEMEQHMALMMWNVTYYLQLARNSLKNKPWKQSQMLSDHKTFKVNIISAFIALIALCEEVGMDELCFYNVYRAKNQVNLFRIASKY